MRETQSIFRVGKFGVYQVPMNVVVGEMTLITKGDLAGTEKMKERSKSFHKNYEHALYNLLDRMIEDNMSQSSVELMKTLIESIDKSRKDILTALKETRLN